MILDMKLAADRQRHLIVGAWLLALASGAVATSLLRVPIGIAGIGSAALVLHIAAGAMAGGLALGIMMRTDERYWISRALAVTATLAAGWLARRSFAPATVATHAAVAALTTTALAAGSSRSLRALASAPPRRHSWRATVAGAGFLLLVVQVVLGALLRHHLAGLGWHVLVAGLAALAILVPAVSIAQDSHATGAEKRASVWAIGSILTQAALGLLILVFMMTGSANAGVWLFMTVAHVVIGSVSLLAAGHLARALRQTTLDARDRGPAGV